jgi:hypothetical protein
VRRATASLPRGGRRGAHSTAGRGCASPVATFHARHSRQQVAEVKGETKEERHARRAVKRQAKVGPFRVRFHSFFFFLSMAPRFHPPARKE